MTNKTLFSQKMLYPNIAKALNLKQEVNSLDDLRKITCQGITQTSIDALAKHLSLSDQEMIKFLHISKRTLKRYEADHLLSPEITDHLVQLAKVYTRAVETFEDQETAIKWLKEPCMAIGNIKPLDYLTNSSGIEMVLDELGRIEYGVFA